MRTVTEHLAQILGTVRRLDIETVPVHSALGRTTAEPVCAAVDIPVFDNSAMDGFAVHFADVADASEDHPVTLAVVADLPAGSAADPTLGTMQAARIMTGSPVPADADAIVPFEDTREGLTDDFDTVTVVCAPREAGRHIRRAGEDMCSGDVVLDTGVPIGPWQASAVAAAGIAEVRVARRPRVAVISTGNELAAPGVPLKRGQIPESNSLLLAGLVTDAGGVVVCRESVDDRGEGLRHLLARMMTGPEPADAVVFSGGVSAGAYEVVKSELAEAMTFTKVAMQPGKPQGFGVLPVGTLLFGLPGNPVSAAVSFEVFVRPALLAMQGRRELHRPVLRLPTSATWRTSVGRRQYLPVVIDRTDPTRWTVRPATAGGSGSHLAGGLGRAEAYAVVPDEVDSVARGDLVDVMVLGG